MKRLALLLFALLLLPATAQADTWGSAAERARPYTDFAQLFWAARGGYVDCPQGVEVTWWDWGLNEGASANGYNGIGGCHLWINPDAWRPTSRGWRCQMVLHEWGHLIGLSHEPDPRHIMYGEPVRRQHPACYWFNR